MYTRVNWEDLPSTNTPRNATNLNKMDAGIKENDDKLNGTKAMGSIVVDDVNCKNLLSSFMELGSLNNDTGATATSTDAIRTANFVEVEPNTTYTVSNDKQYHVYIYEYSSPSSSGFIKYTGANTDTYKGKSTITTTSTTKYIKIRTVVSNVENDLTSKWQLEKGLTATEYTEYKQPVKKTSIGVKESCTFYANDFKCRNLFDKNNANILDGLYIDSGQNKILSSSGNKVLYIPIVGGKTYTVSKRLSDRFTIATTNVLPANNVSTLNVLQNNSATHLTITAPANANYLCVHFYRSSDTLTPQQILDSIQIELGNEVTELTSFKGFGYVSGNNSNGSYIKYDDGTMVCYGNYSMSTTCSTALTNGGYRNSGGSTSLRVTYPQPFISAPSITVTTTSLNCIGCKPDSPSTTYFTALFVTINSESSATTKTANYVAIGRWK